MRGRVAGVGVSALVLVAMLAALGAPAASAACPNEAFRVGPSALLPECRAYEMVTPVDKESGEGAAAGLASAGAHAAPSGEGIYFHSFSPFAGAQSNLISNPYVSSRLGSTWSTQAIGGPQASPVDFLLTSVFAVSDDLRFAMVGSLEALAPGAVPGDSNLYVRDNRTGTYTLVLSVSGNERYFTWTSVTGGSSPLVAATADWNTLLVEGPDGLYEFSDGRLRFAAAGARPEVTPSELFPNKMSADGTRFIYRQEESLYMNRRGEEPLLVADKEEGGEPVSARFVGASPDEDTVYYATNTGLFSFEAFAPPGSRVTRITPAAGLGENESTRVFEAFSSRDGGTVYFVTNDRLTPDAEPLGANEAYVYVWRDEGAGTGRIRFLTGLDGLGTGISMSTDGRFLAFSSRLQVTPDAVGTFGPSCTAAPGGFCENVFLYSYDTGRIVCATCNGSEPAGTSRLGGLFERIYTDIVPRALLDDGTLFVDTPNALSPRDVNGAVDLYAYRDGSSRLVSTGTDPVDSNFVEATADGSDVFFVTKQQLVGQDTDSASDLYDARVDGGLPQAGNLPVTPCADEGGCRGGTTAALPPAPPASGAVEGSDVAGGCIALAGKAGAARRRSRALGRRAKAAEGKRAKTLRKKAVGEAQAARAFGRRARACLGGGR